MVLCKFFEQGNCRFGNDCKFEHQKDDTGQFRSILHQQNVPQANPSKTPDVAILIKSVANDMSSAEKGGQWPLSCYAPFREKCNFPGFDNISFEEVRHGFYEAQKNGNVVQYQNGFLASVQDALTRLHVLQDPPPDLVNVIKNIYNSPATSNSTNSFGNATAKSTVNSPFGGGDNIFGNVVSKSSAFSNSNQFKFGSNSGSIFNTSPLKQNQKNLQNSIFIDNNFNVDNFFGSECGNFSNNNSDSSSSTPVTQYQTISSNSFQQPVQGSEGSGNQGNQKSIFNHQGGTSNFGGQIIQNSVFGNCFSPGVLQVPQNIATTIGGQFIPQTQTSSVAYGVQANQLKFGTPSQNIFSGNQSNCVYQPFNFTNSFGNKDQFNQNLKSNSHSDDVFNFGSSSSVINVKDENFYVKVENLTEDEKKWFEDSKFEYKHVPETPPNVNICL